MVVSQECADLNYKTVKYSKGYYEEKGSKFISFVFSVSSIEQIKLILHDLRTENPKSVHVCYGYRIGVDEIIERNSDDGEPNNSAGPPILNQIRHFNITNTLVAVVRYYGGINLGVGGLMKAYKIAAKNALESAEIVEKTIEHNIRLSINPSLISSVLQFVNRNNIQIIKEEFDENYILTIAVEHGLKSLLDQFVAEQDKDITLVSNDAH